MSYITKAELEWIDNAGPCQKCGIPCEKNTRNTIGYCSACHNAHNRAIAEAWSKQKAENKRLGFEYWKKRDVKVGDKMQTLVGSFFSPAGVIIYGIAKVGSNGAYVFCDGKRCNADRFAKSEDKN